MPIAFRVWLQAVVWRRVGARRCAPAVYWTVLAMVLLVCSGWRTAAEPADYLIDVWDTENDLPNSSVTAIAQTPDGYLWVGTYNGLARFDGVRFVTFEPQNTPALQNARIQDLFLDVTGTLWIYTYRGGLTSYREGHFQQEWRGKNEWEWDLRAKLAFSSSNLVFFVTQFGEVLRREQTATNSAPVWSSLAPPERARLNFQCAERDGTLWFLTRDGHIVRFAGQEFKELAPELAPPGGTVTALATDARGRVWAGSDQGLAVREREQFQAMNPTNGEPALEPNLIFPTRDGGLWVLAGGRVRKQLERRWVAEAREWKGLLGLASGRSMGAHKDRAGGIWFNHYGNGLFHITPEGQFQRFTVREGLPGDRIGAWFQGSEGDIWVGVDRGGLARLRERRFQVIGPAEGLPARAALSVCEDETGALWFGTSGGGLCRWQGRKLESYAIRNDPSANFVFSVFPQAGQGLWLSAAGEDLFVFRDGQIRRAPWEVHGVKALLTDHTGRVWMGTKSGVNWWTAEQRHSFGSREGMPATAVRALAQTQDGLVWCGNDEGALYRCEPERLETFRPTDALAGKPILSLLADSHDGLWAGTFRGGLLRFKAGRFARLTTDQGLPSDVITGILEDGQGQLWLGTHRGICRVAKATLNNCLEGRTAHVDCVTYGRLDGLPTQECAGNYQPSCWRARDGRLWFATVKGMVSVQPTELKNNPVPPPVVIEELRVDGERLPLDGGPVVLSPGRSQFEFRFTALSFIAPDKVRFRYQLEGLDNGWVEADTRRTAHYSHLPAGKYRFHVLACNNDGIWNERGGTLSFVVQPYFYQTAWFLALVCAAVVGGVALGVHSATRREYRRALARLEQQHAVERDRARIAKDIHDDLGAGLTQITLLSELARREAAVAANPHLDRITDTARKMTKAMDEIVWAVDPQHDTLSGLMDYISAFTEEFLRTADIRCRMDLPAELPPLRVEAEQRYNLFLALKEALNNIVKHARASEVWLRLQLAPGELALIVEDNGQGLAAEGKPEGNADRLSSGHGLANLEKRLSAIGGRCTLHSGPGQGTRVDMTVPVTAAASPIVAISEPPQDIL